MNKRSLNNFSKNIIQIKMISQFFYLLVKRKHKVTMMFFFTFVTKIQPTISNSSMILQLKSKKHFVNFNKDENEGNFNVCSVCFKLLKKSLHLYLKCNCQNRKGYTAYQFFSSQKASQSFYDACKT